MGVAGQVAQLHIRRWLHRPGRDDLGRPAVAALDVAQQLRHIPAGTARHRHGQIGAVYVARQQCGLRNDLCAVALEVHQHHLQSQTVYRL